MDYNLVTSTDLKLAKIDLNASGWPEMISFNLEGRNKNTNAPWGSTMGLKYPIKRFEQTPMESLHGNFNNSPSHGIHSRDGTKKAYKLNPRSNYLIDFRFKLCLWKLETVSLRLKVFQEDTIKINQLIANRFSILKFFQKLKT